MYIQTKYMHTQSIHTQYHNYTDICTYNWYIHHIVFVARQSDEKASDARMAWRVSSWRRHVHICTYTYIHICRHANIQDIYRHACMYTHIHTYRQPYLYSRIYTYIHTYIRTTYIHTYIRAYMLHAYMHTSTYTQRHVRTYTRTHIYTYTRIHVHTYV